MKLGDGDRLLFIGDSITDCGRDHPIGKGAGLGEGYVAFIDSLLAARHPQRRIEVLNAGVGGNMIADLEARWQTDVLDLEPDWLSIMIGINDVWRQFERPSSRDQVSLERYEETYRRLLEQTEPSLSGLVLMTPYYLQTNQSDAMRQQTDAYGLVVKNLAAHFGAVFVDVQAAFDNYLSHRAMQSLSRDRIHVNKTGHMIIAQAFFTAIGFEWDPSGKLK